MRFMILLLVVGFAIGLFTGNRAWQTGSCLVEDYLAPRPYPTPTRESLVQKKMAPRSSAVVTDPFPFVAFLLSAGDTSGPLESEKDIPPSVAGPYHALKEREKVVGPSESIMQLIMQLKKLCIIQE